MTNLSKVATVGVFDLFHLGHLRLLEKAAKYGDSLMVGVHDDKLGMKGVQVLYSVAERVEIISSLKCVDEVYRYERVDEFLSEHDFDVFVYGPDQEHRYFQSAFRYCRERGKAIVEIPRTDGISSSDIRSYLRGRGENL